MGRKPRIECAAVVDATRIRKGDLVFLPREPEGCRTTRTHFEPATLGRYGVSVGHTYRADNLERIVLDKITNRSGVDKVYLVTGVEETRSRGLPSNVYDLMSNSTSARPSGPQIRKFTVIDVPDNPDPLSEERRVFASCLAVLDTPKLLDMIGIYMEDLEVPSNGRRYKLDAADASPEDVFDELWDSTSAQMDGEFASNIRSERSSSKCSVLEAVSCSWLRCYGKVIQREDRLVLTPKLARAWIRNGASVMRPADPGAVFDLAVESVMARYAAFLEARAGVMPGFVAKLREAARLETALRRKFAGVHAEVRKHSGMFRKFICETEKGDSK